MKTSKENQKTVLAVDPSTRGFGFAILEGPKSLLEWGVKEVRGKKNAGALKHVAELIECYKPDVIVMEDCADTHCRRGARVRRLIQDISKLATGKRIKVRRISPRIVRAVLSGSPSAKKQQIAATIAQQFPELASRLPQLRKPWMSEDPRMGIFDAVALALTFFSES
jgi:Holliday junction resolvasome RuvABC endonuclease subunit